MRVATISAASTFGVVLAKMSAPRLERVMHVVSRPSATAEDASSRLR